MYKKVNFLRILCLLIIQISSYTRAYNAVPCTYNTDGYILNISEDCTSYTQCRNDKPTTFNCPSGLAFSIETGICVLLPLSDCRQRLAVHSELYQQTHRTCIDNEKRSENQVACRGQPFGELVPYPGNCAKFLVCDCEYPTVKDCAPGTWFDNKLKVCNFPQNVECDNGGGEISTTTEINTTQSPSTEINTTSEVTTEVTTTSSKTTETPTPSLATTETSTPSLPTTDLTTSSSLGTTEITTSSSSATDITTISSTWKPCDTSPNTTPSTTSTTSSNDWGQNCKEPEGMTADICLNYDNNILLHYPYNCNAYINCTQGCPVMNYCRPDKVFNDVLKICDTPETAHCESLPMPSTTTTIGTTAAPWFCDPPYGVSHDICRMEYPGTLLPYPYNCSSYILCNWRCPHLRHCAPNEIFNQKLGKCDCKENAECSEIPYPTTEPPATPVTCEPLDGINSDICRMENPGTLLPYPYNCSSYILCNWRCPHLRHCAPNEIFNQKLGKCDCKENAECSEIPYPTTEPPATPVTCEPLDGISSDICRMENPGTLLPYPYNCSSYILCNWRCPHLRHCSSNEVFDEKLGKCNSKENTECSEIPYPTTEPSTTPSVCEPLEGISEDICSQEDPGTYLPYPYNCSSYILCNWRCPHLRQCGPNQIFNKLLGICDNNSSVECKEIPFPTPGTTTTESTAEATTTTLPPDVDTKFCQDKEDYKLYPYEANCQKYLLCLNGLVEMRSCPNGWLFNAQLEMCDDAGEEVCYKSTTTVTPTTTTTTEKPSFDLCIDQPEGVSFPYRENCQMYYFCRGNDSYYLVHCPHQNYYDPSSGDCGPDVSPKACKEPMTTSTMTTTVATTLTPEQMCVGHEMGDTFPYEANCHQYIMCMAGGRYKILNCPANNLYYPDSGNCGPGTDEDICRKGTETESTTTTATTVSSTTSTTTMATTLVPTGGICGELHDGQLIKYPQNCQKYISCVRPIPIAFYCPNQWYFNAEEEKCIPDLNDNCSQTPSSTTPSNPSNICKGQEKGQWQIYSANCQMYYECLADDKYMLKICPENEYFNPLHGQCSSQVDDEYCQQDFDTTTAMTPTHAPKPPNNLCWQKPNGSKVPYPQECAKYIVCEQPIPVGYNCPAGLEFSSKWQACVEPQYSDCSATTPEPIPESQCKGKPDYTLLPYEKDCRLFIICIKNFEHMALCHKGQYFDSQIGECSNEANEESCQQSVTNSSTTTGTISTSEVETTSTTVSVDPNLGPCVNKPQGTKVPYPYNCEKFIVCREPTPIVYDCPKGLEFSEALEECVEPSKANCRYKTTTELPTSSASSSETTTERYSDLCYQEENGCSYGNTKNCSQFYICLNGSSYLTYCPENSYYNSKTKECNAQTSSEACKEGVTTTTDTTTEMTSSITHTRPTTTETPSTAPHSDNICCGKTSGTILPYPNDKTKFVICQYPLPEIHVCPKGTVFYVLRGGCESPVQMMIEYP